MQKGPVTPKGFRDIEPSLAKKRREIISKIADVLDSFGFVPLETPTIEFAELFESKYPEYKITAVTGWGGLNLIVINTDKIDGGTGPSFWFDLSGHSFIRLSNRFN